MLVPVREERRTLGNPGEQVDTPANSAVSGRTRCLSLAAGGQLAWSEFGRRHGYPVLYFHSQGGSRLEGQLLHEAAVAAGFRLIAVDRPGIGLSSFRPLTGHSQFNTDLIALIDHLDLETVALLSWAGGGPFALAFAQQYPSRVSSVNMMSPFPVMPDSESALSRILLAGLRGAIYLRHSLLSRRVEHYMDRARERLCYSDRKQFDNPGVRRILRQDALEASRQGGRGVAFDSAMSFRKWDFDPAGVVAPVHLWQGGADTLSVPCSALRLHAVLSGAVLHTVARQGHLFFTTSADDIFRACRQALCQRD